VVCAKDKHTGQVTTHPVEIPADEKLWINAELGDDGGVEPVLLDGRSKIIATGKLTDTMSQTIYRLVEWDQSPPAGKYLVQVNLSGPARLFSIRVTAH